MAIKCVLVLVLVSIPTIIGIKKARKYEQREQILRESKVLFRRISNDISYNLTTLPNAIEASRQDFTSDLKDVMGSISTSILENTYSEEMVVHEINNMLALKPYDKQIISNCITSLGTSDVESQVGIMNNTIKTIEDLESDAKEEKNKNSKLYRTIGLVAGLMLAIVII